MRLIHFIATCCFAITSFAHANNTPFHIELSEKLKFDDLVLGEQLPKEKMQSAQRFADLDIANDLEYNDFGLTKEQQKYLSVYQSEVDTLKKELRESTKIQYRKLKMEDKNNWYERLAYVIDDGLIVGFSAKKVFKDADYDAVIALLDDTFQANPNYSRNGGRICIRTKTELEPFIDCSSEYQALNLNNTIEMYLKSFFSGRSYIDKLELPDYVVNFVVKKKTDTEIEVFVGASKIKSLIDSKMNDELPAMYSKTQHNLIQLAEKGKAKVKSKKLSL